MQSNSIKLEVVRLVQNGEKYKAIYEKKAGGESAFKTYYAKRGCNCCHT
jgi:hypothetical protein